MGQAMRQWPGWLRRLDVRRPMHAVAVGLIIAGVVAPVANWAATNQRYRLAESDRAVIATPAPHLMSKLTYDATKRASIFNAKADGATDPVSGGTLAAETGGGAHQLYSATLPDDASQGIAVQDNVNNVTVTFRPEMGLLSGRATAGQVAYPLQNQAGQMIFTPKGNGLKEDILLTQPPQANTADYRYRLSMPDYVQARIDDDGSVGFYTASPEFFGNITYGTPQDQQLINRARQNGTKNYLMFKIPTPVVRQTGRGGNVLARFNLVGDELSVHVAGLAQAGYPLSIDPTFLLSSTSDFVLGSVDDNIDLTQANQVGRSTLSGGSVSGWTVDTNSLASGDYAAGLVAYNSALYLIGGGNQDGTTTNATTTQVMHVLLNSNGTENGTWATDTNSLNTARQGLVAFGFNGYLYAVGGENTSAAALSSVEYAKINSDGSVGTWTTSTHSLTVARGYAAGAIYQGVMYVVGGSSGTLNASLLSSTEYSRIGGDGSVGTWSTTGMPTLPTATNRLVGGAYNGFVYVAGGFTNPGTAAVVNTVLYAPIKSDGTLGSFVTTTAFPTARRDHGFAVVNGHIYIYAGCSSATLPCATANLQPDTEYAVINADGSVGQWQRTEDYNYQSGTTPFGPRTNPSSAFYNGFLHFVGGCNAEASSANNHCTSAGLRVGTFFTGFDVTGRFDRGIQTVQTTQPYNNNASTLARMGGRNVALNGYMYYVGGCSVATCNTATSYSATVEYAPINANGSLGTFTATNSLISTSGGANNAGRIGHSVLAYNNKIYVIGGVERTTGNVDSFRSDVISATQNSNGTLGTFAAEANSLPVAKAFATAAVWHNWLYVVGGLSAAGTVVGTIYHAQISSNAPGTWTATTTGLTNARWGQSGGIWGNWLYVVGGQSNTTGTYITAANGTEQLTITNSGDITAAASVQNVTGAPLTRLMGGFVHNGVIYTFGGYTSGSTSAVTTINWSKLNASTGALGAWSNTNIGNAITCTTTCPASGTYGLATARGATTAAAANGVFYVMGGCTATMATTTFSSCGTFVTTTNTTEVSLANNGGTGQTNAFAAATALPTVSSTAGRADHATVAYNGYLYILGGCFNYTSGACTSGDNMTDVEGAPINADGSLGSWTTTGMTALPSDGSSLGGAVAYNGHMYVVAGKTNSTSASTKVWYATISSTGTIGSWVDSTSNYLPSGTDRNAFGLAVARGYLYVAGGDNGSGTKKSDVYYTQISSTSGALSAPGAGCSGNTWCSTTSFTTARSGLSLASYNGDLYVVGGTDGTNNLADVQYAATSASDGSITAWNYATDVPRGMAFRQAVAANGYMYFIGDEGSGTDAAYVDINANGTLGTTQSSVNLMAGGHSHGAAAMADGFIYVNGGCTLATGACSTVLTSGTSEYAGQAGIARVGHYSKLFNTQVDTAPSQLVVNGGLSGPGSQVALRFYTATAASSTFGVAQLFSPMILGNFYNVQALDSSGTNVGVATNYLLIFALDDSNSGTFPDVTSATETFVNSVTLYYHANPGRRLRHGAAFSNTGCNPTPANGCILDTAP